MEELKVLCLDPLPVKHEQLLCHSRSSSWRPCHAIIFLAIPNFELEPVPFFGPVPKFSLQSFSVWEIHYRTKLKKTDTIGCGYTSYLM